MKKFALRFLAFSLYLIVQSCGTNSFFEKTEMLPKHAWAAANRLSFTCAVKDTTVFYNIYIILTHTDAYHYNNIYLDVTTIAPGDTAITTQKAFQLAKNNYGWLGTAMDDIIEHRMLLTANGPVKLKSGNYSFMLRQAMREDPLAEILSAGVRVEKVIQ